MILVSSCQQFPELKKPITRCGTFIKRIDENTYQGKCRCHEYMIHFESGKFQRVSDSIDYPLDHCSNYVALSPADWGILRVQFDDISLWLKEIKKATSRK